LILDVENRYVFHQTPRSAAHHSIRQNKRQNGVECCGGKLSAFAKVEGSDRAQVASFVSFLDVVEERNGMAFQR